MSKGTSGATLAGHSETVSDAVPEAALNAVPRAVVEHREVPKPSWCMDVFATDCNELIRRKEMIAFNFDSLIKLLPISITVLEVP